MAQLGEIELNQQTLMSRCVEFGLNSGLHFRGTLSIDTKKQKANIGIDIFLPSKAQKE